MNSAKSPKTTNQELKTALLPKPLVLQYISNLNSLFMIIGVPKEIKDNENRVAMVGSGVAELVAAGHTVLIQQGAGMGSGETDEKYTSTGAELVKTAAEIFERADMIVKVKEPQAVECDMLREGQILFTFLHLAPLPDLTENLLKKKVIGIAYETVRAKDMSLPLLTPMSEVAGKLAVQIGQHYLENNYEDNHLGAGILLGGVPGVEPAEVVIVGGGVAGINTAKVAIGAGANVTILERNLARLRYLADVFNTRVTLLASNSYNMKHAVAKADLLVGSVLVPGALAPKLVTEEMVKTMKKGSVIVDIAIDQGGCVATSEVTSHTDPIVMKHNVIHYGVPNMPGLVPRTSTYALTNATLPFAIDIANKGAVRAATDDRSIREGFNTYQGQLTYKAVADAQKREYAPIDELLGIQD